MIPDCNQIRSGFELNRRRKIPLHSLIVRLIIKSVGIVSGIVLMPVAFVLHVAGFRHVNVFVSRIGHLALEPDCLVKEQLMEGGQRNRWILLAPEGKVANEYLLTYWYPYFHVIRNRFACFLVESMSRWGIMRYDISHYARVFDRAQESYRIYAEWGGRAPLLSLRTEDEAWGEQQLESLGLPKDAWFACLHVREGGFSPVDEELHRHRNGDIEHTLEAVEEIVKRGGWVIRLGDPTMKPLPLVPNVIDYAHHPMKSDRLDVIICAKARFILGSTSGICLVPAIFGVPAAIANMVPTAERWYGAHDISIPKRIRSLSESRDLGLDEIFSCPAGCYSYAQQYDEAGLELLENSPEEIRLLACEIMDELDGRRPNVNSDAVQPFMPVIDDRCVSVYSKARVASSFFQM